MKGHLNRRPSLRPVGRSAGGDSLQRRPLPPRFLPASLICKPHTEQTGCDSTGTTRADNIVLKHAHMLLLQLLLLLLLLCHADTKASSSRFWGQRLQALRRCECPLSYILRSSKMNIRDTQSSSAGRNVSLTKTWLPSLLNYNNMATIKNSWIFKRKTVDLWPRVLKFYAPSVITGVTLIQLPDKVLANKTLA